MEPVIQAGLHKKFIHQLGNRSQIFKRSFFQTSNTDTSGLVVQPNGSLAVNKTLKDVKIFINDHPASAEAVRIWYARQVEAVVKIWQFDAVKKDSTTTALLIYATEN